MAKSKRRKCICGRNYVRKGRNYCSECEAARDPLPPPSLKDIGKALRKDKPVNKQIVFAFGKEVPKEKKDVILKKIGSWREVRSVERIIDKTDTNASSVDLYVVYLKTGEKAYSLVHKIGSFSGIKYAILSSPRKPK